MTHTNLPIAKAHAYGNDFLYVREDDVHGLDRPALARAMCNRFTGIGADGVIIYRHTPDGAAIQLINSDGSPAEVSGNGVRCLGALLVWRGEVPASPERPIVIQSDGGTKRLHLIEASGHRYLFRALMGQPEHLQQVTVDTQGERFEAATLWMGNPQCVILGPLPDPVGFHRLGPGIATHPMFPAGTNVEFAQVTSPASVRILIWERGAGPTQSSGTGSCAAAVVAAAYGGARREVDVVAPGGAQHVNWTDAGVELTGWADIVLEGTWVAQLP